LKVAIHSRTFYQNRIPCFKAVIEELLKRNVEVLVSSDLYRYLKSQQVLYTQVHIFNGPADLQGVKFMFSVGGDGTLLETVTLVHRQNIPIIGINTGRLGFLATIPNEKISEAIGDVFSGRYKIERRTLVQAETSNNIFGEFNYALNEFAITKRDTSSMIIVHTYIDGEYLNSYWADGLIIATPTGSTGYSLSVGGPVVMPALNNIFIISPVSPHNLTVRPLIVPNDCVLSFSIEGRGKNFLVSLDSRSVVADEKIKLSVRKSDFDVGLVKLEQYRFTDTLRRKLNWGYDARN